MARRGFLPTVLVFCSLAAVGVQAQERSSTSDRKAASPIVTPPNMASPPAPSAQTPPPSQTAPELKDVPIEGANKSTPQWPRVLPKDEPPLINGWKKEEVDLARAQCTAVLAGLNAVTTQAEPIREGDCGAVAPVELISIGTSPKVTFNPPAIVTCDMVAALDRWFKTDVQPAARSLLGSPINRVEIMSSYSCRTAYGRKRNKLSEHGRANAIDVRALITERGETVELLTDWGMTERDIAAQIAAAKAEQQRREAADAAAKLEVEAREAERRKAAKSEGPKAQSEQPAEQPSVGAFAAPRILRGTIVDQNPVIAGQVVRPPPPGAAPAFRLGGPKEPQIPTKTIEPAPPKERFLRRIHKSACQTFATILGPESNDAHRNHFHIDLAERNSGKFCE